MHAFESPTQCINFFIEKHVMHADWQLNNFVQQDVDLAKNVISFSVF
jgi:hypothetical protein